MIRTCEAHSHPGTNHSSVVSQVHENRRRQRHEAAGEKTVEGADDNHGSQSTRRDQTQSQDTRDESAGNDRREGQHLKRGFQSTVAETPA